MSSHSTPSIIQHIDSDQALLEKWNQLTLSLLSRLKGSFQIPFPTVVNTTELSIEEKIARYPSNLDSNEFIDGAIAAINPQFRKAHEELIFNIGVSVLSVASLTINTAVGGENGAFCQTFSSKDGYYVSSGAAIQACSATDWGTPKGFCAAAVIMAIWLPPHQYPSYPPPVRLSNQITWN